MNRNKDKMPISKLSLKDPFRIARYIASSLTGELTEEEREQLDAWRLQSERHQQLYDRLLNEETRKLKRERLASFDKKEGWKGYKEKQSHEARRRIRVRFRRYAAAALLPVGIALYFLIGEQKTEKVIPVARMEVITPGEPRARLTLPDGQVIDLEREDGVILQDESGALVVNKEHRLSYSDTCSWEGVAALEEYHITSVPKCGEYQLKLSDGTLVYLNSMSRLRYPVRFTGDTREVELEGEAFFKVAKNADKPFIVKTASYNVKVLGTEFNVLAYREESETSTTLVEGSVEVSGEGLEVPLKLKPSEQFRLDKSTGRAEVVPVDVSYSIAWKEGMFRFRDVRLEDIMRVVERWYDVKVVFEHEEAKDFRFGFNVSRHAEIDPLLRIFELNGKVKIRCEGKVLKIKRGR